MEAPRAKNNHFAFKCPNPYLDVESSHAVKQLIYPSESSPKLVYLLIQICMIHVCHDRKRLPIAADTSKEERRQPLPPKTTSFAEWSTKSASDA